MATSSLENAYHWCETLAHSHYENFPVASRLLPSKLRRPIAVIYAFARVADDISDEGIDPLEKRLEKLQELWQALSAIQQGHPPPPSTPPLFLALQEIIQHWDLPIDLFFDLLRAFQQDLVKKDYETVEELLQYCQYSANPIGRLILHLAQQATPRNCQESDAICTALQLINFLQDLDSDLKLRERCYLPQADLRQFSLDPRSLIAHLETPAVRALIDQQWQRAHQLLQKGKPLAKRIPGLLGLELRLIVRGGEQMLKLLAKRKSVYERPRIKLWHWPVLLVSTLVTF